MTEAPDDRPPRPPPPDLTSPPALSPVDLLVRDGMAPEVFAAQKALLRLWNEGGSPAPIFERRALAIGRFCHYLESLMDAAPEVIQTHGPLYTRLVEAERRAWEAERQARRAVPVGETPSDLAHRAKVVDGDAYPP